MNIPGRSIRCLALAACLVASGPVLSAKRDNAVRFAYDQAPENVDPFFNNVRIGVIIGQHVRDSLIYRDPTSGEYNPYASLNPKRSIASIVSLPLEVHRIGTASERRRTVGAMLERVGLPPRFMNRYPRELSGGQRQRVAIARALVMRPEIVVCDEPTSALDVSVQSQILNLLTDLRRDFNLTYVFISHNLAVIEHIATRVAVMYLGRIVELADTAELFARPKHPYTRALLASVLTPEPGLGIPETGLGLAFPDPLDPPPGCPFHPRCPDRIDVCRLERPPLARTESGLAACHVHAPSPEAAAA